MDNIKKSYKKNYKLYKAAAELTNVPPHFLAAIHYRENSFRLKNTGPGGPMQFDPPLTKKRIRQLLSDYSSCSEKIINKFVGKGQNNIFISFVLSGCFVQAKLKYDNKSPLKKEMTSKSNENLIMRAFELYNGTAYGSVWKSPYVVNMLDKDHMYMKICGTYIDKRGTRRKVDHLDRRPGAYTVFSYLDKIFEHKWVK